MLPQRSSSKKRVVFTKEVYELHRVLVIIKKYNQSIHVKTYAFEQTKI